MVKSKLKLINVALISVLSLSSGSLLADTTDTRKGKSLTYKTAQSADVFTKNIKDYDYEEQKAFSGIGDSLNTVGLRYLSGYYPDYDEAKAAAFFYVSRAAGDGSGDSNHRTFYHGLFNQATKEKSDAYVGQVMKLMVEYAQSTKKQQP